MKNKLEEKVTIEEVIERDVYYDWLQRFSKPPALPIEKRIWTAILKCLKQDIRMPLTRMSRRTGIPISTLFDHPKTLNEDYEFDFVIRPKEHSFGFEG